MTNKNDANIGVLDIGLGNIRSIERMLFKAGSTPIVIDSPSQLNSITKIILPGVGHFDAGMKRLKETGFDLALIDSASNSQLVLLGICLGMQLLCGQSEEGILPGLGLIDANVERFAIDQPGLKLPHMGWNNVKSAKANPLLPDLSYANRFYFVHSFKVIPTNPDIMIGTTNYSGDFCSAFQQCNIFGVQFHPEKSHRFGMELFKRFISL